MAFKIIYQEGLGADKIRQILEERGFDLCNLFPNNDGHFPFLIEMDGLFVKRAEANTYKRANK